MPENNKPPEDRSGKAESDNPPGDTSAKTEKIILPSDISTIDLRNIPREFIPVIAYMIGRPRGHWRDSSYRIFMNNCPLDVIKFFLPEIAFYIDTEAEPNAIPTPLFPIGATSDVESRTPDFVWKFSTIKTIKPEIPGIILSLEQQHDNEPNLALRINQTCFRLMDRYYGDLVIGFAFFTGESCNIDTDYVRMKCNLGFSGKIGTYYVKTVDIDELKNDKRPFALAILASLYSLKAGKDPKERGKYAVELLNLLKDSTNTTPEYKNAFIYFICGILQLYEDDISFEIKERWLMESISTMAQFREDCREKFLAEGEAKTFLEMLPQQFELMKFRPSYEPELIELGASKGVSKETIEAEHAKWLKSQENKS
jgi:hypothetical protein